LYTAEGDWFNAGISLAAAVPLAGQFATAGKLGGKARKAIKYVNFRRASRLARLKRVRAAVKLADEVAERAKLYDKINGQGLYILRDQGGIIRYIGIGDVPTRIAVHARDFAIHETNNIRKSDLIGFY